MEGERILKSLLNGETDDLYEDTKNYLAPLRSPSKTKNGCKVRCKVAEETVSKYTLFSTKFLRCAIETLKNVKARGNHLDELTNSLNLVSTLLSDTLCIQNGTYLKFIPSLDQLGKTIYLIIIQLISKAQFDKALCHADDLLKFIQVVKSWKNYDSNKMDKELSSLAIRASDALLQGAGKLEEVKVTPAERASHLCVILDWRKLSLLFQVEAITHASLKSLVDKTLKCGTKYQLDCGQKNVNFNYLASFFKSVFNKLMVKSEQLITSMTESMLFLVEMGFHYGRICSKAGNSTQASDVFDKLLETVKNHNHTKNGQSKLQVPSQVCCCVCLVCKATILSNCSSNSMSQTLHSYQEMLLESNRLIPQLLKCKGLSSSMLKLLSDSLEYFRVPLQNISSKGTSNKMSSWRTSQEAVQLLKLYVAILSLQCEQIKTALHKANCDNLIAQFTQQLQKTTVRQLTVLNFVISLHQDQLKSEKNAKDCNRTSRIHVLRDCFTVAQQASTLLHSALEDPDTQISPNELRWLGSSVYNVGCVAYQKDCFAEAVPLLVLACAELKIWSFGAETEQEIITQTEEVKLLAKYALLADCQRRAGQLDDALKTASTQVLIALKTTSGNDMIRQQVKQWTSIKHELLKDLLDEEKLPERSRTLCSAFAEQEDAKDVEGSQLCLVLQEELACYKTKSYDTAVEQIAVIKQLMELYIVQEDEFQYASAILELGIALNNLGDAELEEEKSALECCQEAAAVLEQLSDRVDDNDEEENMHSLVMLDRLGAVYLWQALFEHKKAMEEKSTSAMSELSDSYEAEEVEATSLEQPFVSSLYTALEMWTVLRTKSVQQDTSGKVNGHHFANPEETCHYLLITAAMFGLLNQPFKKVCALNLAASASQAVGTSDMLDIGLCALSDAIHSLCDVLDLSHAALVLCHAHNLVDTYEPSSSSRVQFLMAKSHYLLVSGKFLEGEDSLKEALQSEVFTHKSYKSHLLKARWKSMCCKYSMLPIKLHEITVTADPMLGSLTALECAVDGLHKLSQMAEEVFGLDVFCTGRQKQKQKENESYLLMMSTGSSQSIFRLSLLNDLLSSLLQVGQLYADQGAVREAFRQFVDGISLARQFSLPYRITEFLIGIAQLEVMQSKTVKSQCRVNQLNGILQPLFKSCSKSKPPEEGIPEPLFTEHPETCECACCLDPVFHVICIKYLMSLSNHLALTLRPEQSFEALDVAKLVCESAACKIKRTYQRLDAVLCHSEPTEGSSKETKKRKGANSAKGRKQKKDTAATESMISHLMFSEHQVTLHCMNAKMLLQNGNIQKGNLVLSKAMAFLNCIENGHGSLPVHLLCSKASLLHLYGVVMIATNKNSPSYVSVDCNWFLKTQMMSMSCGNAAEIAYPAEVVVEEGPELEMPKRVSSRKSRTSKTVEKTATLDNGRKKSSRTKGRGKSNKVEEELPEGEESNANVQQKPKGQTRKQKSSKATCSDMGDHIQASNKQLEQAIQYFIEAFELCQACPPCPLFSDICRGLAFCYGRLTPKLSMYYLNLSMSVTLRHQAVTRTGKRIKRLAKDVSLPLGHDGDMVQLAERLSSLSLDNTSCDDTDHKLAALVKMRNIMTFAFRPDGREKSSSLFSPEEIALLQNMPKEWTVCTLETFTHTGSQDKELMICRIRAGCDPVLIKINTTVGEEQSKDQTGDEVVMDLSKLFQSGVLEEFTDIMNDSVKSMNINNTSEWWALRTRLDLRMKNLLEKLERVWLGRWRGVLLGRPLSKDYHESVMSLVRQLEEKIAHICGSVPDRQLLEVLVDSDFSLSRKETTEALIEITGMNPTSPSFEELLNEFEDLSNKLFETKDKKSSRNRVGGHSTETLSRHPVILILGKDIQHLPWESIPMLFHQPVTRVPSLQFLLSKVSCQRQLPQVDSVKTFFALNPQNNLPNTQKMFQKWFESEDGWHGITGNAPTQEEFKSALTDHELFIYFGHGTGREFLQGDDIQRLDCRAVTLLMGCSSGKLMVGGECEPRGMALNYLLAGCPAIVANLWDVTDKDIDRFSESLLKQWLEPGACLSLPQVLCQSRQACKLKYLIGASPVLYGLPAYIKE